MTQQINVRIEVAGDPTLNNSQDLQELRTKLQQKLEVRCTADIIPGSENSMGDITVAIEILALALSMLNTAIVLSAMYRQQHQRHSITIESNSYTRQLSNYTKEEIDEVIDEIREKELKDIILKIGDE